MWVVERATRHGTWHRHRHRGTGTDTKNRHRHRHASLTKERFKDKGHNLARLRAFANHVFGETVLFVLASTALGNHFNFTMVNNSVNQVQWMPRSYQIGQACKCANILHLCQFTSVKSQPMLPNPIHDTDPEIGPRREGAAGGVKSIPPDWRTTQRSGASTTASIDSDEGGD